MLIRTQNKRGLVIVENCDSICIQDKKGTRFVDIYAYNGSEEDGIYLGGYTNEAKAVKVLDMIQEVYSLSLYSDHAFDYAANVQRPYIFAQNRVFQMPEDSEV